MQQPGRPAVLEAARVRTYSMPASFWPHAYEPGALHVEARIASSVRDELRVLGHGARDWPDFAPAAASVCAITVDERGTLAGGADPRRDCYAAGW